jgi:hypothetical protein
MLGTTVKKIPKSYALSACWYLKTLHTVELPDAVPRQEFRIISDVEYLGTAMVISLIQ